MTQQEIIDKVQRIKEISEEITEKQKEAYELMTEIAMDRLKTKETDE